MTHDHDRQASGDGPNELPDRGDAYRCAYCGRPFARESYRALHRGLEHPSDLSADEREAFEQAREDERRELRKFRLKALGVLVILYFGLLMTYAVYA